MEVRAAAERVEVRLLQFAGKGPAGLCDVREGGGRVGERSGLGRRHAGLRVPAQPGQQRQCQRPLELYFVVWVGDLGPQFKGPPQVGGGHLTTRGSGVTSRHFARSACHFSGPVVASQTRAVVSLLPVRTRLPSGLNATLVTLPVCPLRAAFSCPVSASQTRAIVSQLPVSTRLPSGLNATLVILSVCP